MGVPGSCPVRRTNLLGNSNGVDSVQDRLAARFVERVSRPGSDFDEGNTNPRTGFVAGSPQPSPLGSPGTERVNRPPEPGPGGSTRVRRTFSASSRKPQRDSCWGAAASTARLTPHPGLQGRVRPVAAWRGSVRPRWAAHRWRAESVRRPSLHPLRAPRPDETTLNAMPRTRATRPDAPRQRGPARMRPSSGARALDRHGSASTWRGMPKSPAGHRQPGTTPTIHRECPRFGGVRLAFRRASKAPGRFHSARNDGRARGALLLNGRRRAGVRSEGKDGAERTRACEGRLRLLGRVEVEGSGLSHGGSTADGFLRPEGEQEDQNGAAPARRVGRISARLQQLVGIYVCGVFF